MIFVRPDTHGLSSRGAQAYRGLLESNERQAATSTENARRRRRRRRRAPLVVLALDDEDSLLPDALGLAPGAAIVIRPSRMKSPHGLTAILTYAYLIGVPLIADFTAEGLDVDLERFEFEVVRMGLDPVSRRVYPILEMEGAA